MEFKKHFSSNLQNLSVRKTLILQPPCKPNNQSNNSSQLSNSRSINSSPYNPPYQQDINSQYFSNKQNIISQPTSIDNPMKYGSIRRDENEGRQKMSPIMTFTKVRQNSILSEDMPARKVFLPIQNKRQLNYQSKSKEYSETNLKNSNSFANMLQSNSKNNIRLGSMVFGSLAKKNHIEQNKKNIHQNIGMRQSRSFDRMSGLKTERNEQLDLECMNNDNRPAKYKVIKYEPDDEQILHYCFNCAIPLVKQGFNVLQLSQQDKRVLKMRKSHYMSKSDFYSNGQEIQSVRLSNQNYNSNNVNNDRIRIGEQIKCKIIMKLNKLKVGKEQFTKNVENQLENIDYFYNSVISHVEKQRVSDRQEIMRLKSMRKTQPQNYQSQLSSSLGTIDYMMKNMQGINHQFLNQVQTLIESQVNYPKFKIGIQPKQGFQGKIDEFVYLFDRQIRINLQQQGGETNRSRGKRISQATQQSISRNNPLRFSFQQALQQSRKNKSKQCMTMNDFNSMNPLYEQNESQLQDSVQVVDHRQNAFRNLFPDEYEQYDQQNDSQHVKQSPVFKQF